MVKMIVVACGAVLLGAVAASAQAPVDRLTLTEALTLADTANPSLRAKGYEVQAIGANELTAALRPNPSATFLAEQFGGGSAALTQYTFNVGQPIELGGKRQRRIDSAKAATRITGFERDDLKRQIAFQIKKSFTDALVAREALSFAERNLAALDEAKQLYRSRAQKREIPEIDLLRLEVERFSFERDAADARQALQVARVALRTAVGPEQVAEEFEVVGDLAFKQIPTGRSELYRLALDARPDLRAAEAARAKARADINLARANAWLDITPQVEYQRIGPDNTIGFGFALPLKVFDRNQGEIARTQAEAKRLEAAREALLAQALAEVDTALAGVTAEQVKVALLRDTYLPKARQLRDAIDRAYRQGDADLLEHLDAQRTHREKALEYLRALGSYWTAVYLLDAAVGVDLEK